MLDYVKSFSVDHLDGEALSPRAMPSLRRLSVGRVDEAEQSLAVRFFSKISKSPSRYFMVCALCKMMDDENRAGFIKKLARGYACKGNARKKATVERNFDSVFNEVYMSGLVKQSSECTRTMPVLCTLSTHLKRVDQSTSLVEMVNNLQPYLFAIHSRVVQMPFFPELRDLRMIAAAKESMLCTLKSEEAYVSESTDVSGLNRAKESMMRALDRAKQDVDSVPEVRIARVQEGIKRALEEEYDDSDLTDESALESAKEEMMHALERAKEDVRELTDMRGLTDVRAVNQKIADSLQDIAEHIAVSDRQ